MNDIINDEQMPVNEIVKKIEQVHNKIKFQAFGKVTRTYGVDNRFKARSGEVKQNPHKDANSHGRNNDDE